MKYTIRLAAASLLLLGGTSAFMVFKNWQVKQDFKVKFTHEDADGVFKKFGGKIVFDENDPAKASFDVTIDVKSVETGNPMRNESIMGDNWLSSNKYPDVKFKAEGAEKKDGVWFTKGSLTIRGVEKAFEVPFTFEKVGDEALFQSSFKINMADFNLSEDDSEMLKLDLRVPVQ